VVTSSLRTPAYAGAWSRMPKRVTRKIVPREESLGAVLRQMRLDRGWSQTEMADRAGIGQPTLSNIENGRKRPYRETLAALENALGVTPDALLEVALREGPLQGELASQIDEGSLVIPPDDEDMHELVDVGRLLSRQRRRRIIRVMYEMLGAPDPDGR
jgi:transcriptional regulator with XRE-family HTH domain